MDHLSEHPGVPSDDPAERAGEPYPEPSRRSTLGNEPDQADLIERAEARR